ncbi:aminoacyl-tRNA hydrolase [Methylolobus aquaticus]|nr:aminoacyl-tRNA hydrolase [Methylolobus aquaticus]
MAPRCIRLIVGLGNPGVQYERTRHNAGFWFVEEVARRHGGTFRSENRGQCEAAEIAVNGRVVHLLKPLLFMNRSGLPVQTYARYRNISPAEILVVHDELDFAPGVAKLKLGGGHGGHNGLRDLIAVLATADFPRLRLGIGRAPSKEGGAAYVLAKAPASEEEAIRAAVGRVADSLPTLIAGDLAAAMNALNAPPQR